MNKYTYDGPVLCFDQLLSNSWHASTYAINKKKAKNNIAYQYKKKNKLLPTANIKLPGTMVELKEGEY